MNKKSNAELEEEIKKAFSANFALTFQLAESLRDSSIKSKKLFPITENELNNISKEDWELLELLIGRFSKLQDMLGSKIFRGIIDLDFEEAGSMRDTINKMEKKYIINDVSDWVLLRKTRNDIIHEYVPRGEKAAETLNNVFLLTPALLEILCNVHKYAKNEIGINLSQFDITSLELDKK